MVGLRLDPSTSVTVDHPVAHPAAWPPPDRPPATRRRLRAYHFSPLACHHLEPCETSLMPPPLRPGTRPGRPGRPTSERHSTPCHRTVASRTGERMNRGAGAAGRGPMTDQRQRPSRSIRTLAGPAAVGTPDREGTRSRSSRVAALVEEPARAGRSCGGRRRRSADAACAGGVEEQLVACPRDGDIEEPALLFEPAATAAPCRGERHRRRDGRGGRPPTPVPSPSGWSRRRRSPRRGGVGRRSPRRQRRVERHLRQPCREVAGGDGRRPSARGRSAGPPPRHSGLETADGAGRAPARPAAGPTRRRCCERARRSRDRRDTAPVRGAAATVSSQRSALGCRGGASRPAGGAGRADALVQAQQPEPGDVVGGLSSRRTAARSPSRAPPRDSASRRTCGRGPGARSARARSGRCGGRRGRARPGSRAGCRVRGVRGSGRRSPVPPPGRRGSGRAAAARPRRSRSARRVRAPRRRPGARLATSRTGWTERKFRSRRMTAPRATIVVSSCRWPGSAPRKP